MGYPTPSRDASSRSAASPACWLVCASAAHALRWCAFVRVAPSRSAAPPVHWSWCAWLPFARLRLPSVRLRLPLCASGCLRSCVCAPAAVWPLPRARPTPLDRTLRGPQFNGCAPHWLPARCACAPAASPLGGCAPWSRGLSHVDGCCQLTGVRMAAHHSVVCAPSPRPSGRGSQGYGSSLSFWGSGVGGAGILGGVTRGTKVTREREKSKKKFGQCEVNFGWVEDPVKMATGAASSSGPTAVAAGLPGLRWDAPSRRARDRGHLPNLTSPHDRDQAMEELVGDFHAASHKRAMKWKWVTIEKALQAWGVPAFPPTRDSILALAASLKAGRYATADSHLQLYRSTCERKGWSLPPALALLFKDCVRSCQRGIGAPTKALALPFRKLGELDLLDDGPWCAGGPLGPACAIVVGAWFLTREIELASSRAALMTLGTDDENLPVVKWQLPASKTDQMALGKAMVHGCACGQSTVCGCPYHAAAHQLRRLARLFPGRFDGGVPDQNLPLFPTTAGQAVEKEAMVATITKAASILGAPLATPDGSARVSGHSLRVTGAQGLAKLGVDTWAVQLLGRWGSSTVLEYVKEVPLELSASWARRAASRASLDQVALGSRPPVVVTASGPQPVPQASLVPLAAQLATEQNLQQQEATERTDLNYIKSSTGIWHKVLPSGRSGPMSTWSTRCGWFFSRSDARLVPSMPEGVLVFSKCQRCAP